MENIQIRKATMVDLPILAEINSFGDGLGKEIALERLPEYINDARLICAESEGRVVGLLYFSKNFFGDKNWFVTQISVDAALRRRGVGESLLKEIIQIAKSEGVLKIFADVQGENVASVTLLSKLNWVEVGNIDIDADDHRKFYRFDI